MYCYEYIFKQFFINIALDFKPQCSKTFYNCCMERIEKLNMFSDVPNPYDIMNKCMEIFILEYDW